MNEKIKDEKTIDYANMKAQLSLDYGVELDETTIIVTNIILSEVNKTLAEQNKKLSVATDKINQSQKSLQVDKEHYIWQPFMYGFGKQGLTSLMVIILAVGFLTAYLSNNDEKKILYSKLCWYEDNYSLRQKGDLKALDEFEKKYPKPKSVQ